MLKKGRTTNASGEMDFSLLANRQIKSNSA